jgi:hypothetical protein
MDLVTQALRGVGCRPTRLWVYNRLKRLFPFVYLPSTQPTLPDFPTEW